MLEAIAVPRLADFLHRFRLQGAPGAPATAAVPVDHTAEVAAELAPIFSLLQEAQRRAAMVVADAERQVAQRRAEVAEQAVRLINEARGAAPAVRAEATAARMALADRDRRALVDAAEAEVRRIESVAPLRMPSVVRELVAQVLATGQGER